MAEEKKDNKKKPDSPKGNTASRYFEELVFLLVGLLLLSLLVTRITEMFRNGDFAGQFSLLERLRDFFLGILWPIFKGFAVVVSAAAIWMTFASLKGMGAVALAEKFAYAAYATSASASAGSAALGASAKKTRWQKILELLESDNSSDWRSAILEADIMLEEVLKDEGYAGDSVGEMLKSADRNEFISLDDAWEAHKTRNRIAHSGSDFQLNQRESKRIVALFEKVFIEFGAI